MRLFLSLWLACCLTQNVLLADDFDLYYLGGQSNMEGFGKSSELDDSLRKPIDGAWIFQATPQPDQKPVNGAGKWEPVQPGHGVNFVFDGRKNQCSDRFGVELSFARRMRELRPNRKIAIVKYARNGSSIDQRAAANWGCWEPDFHANNGSHRSINQYDQFLATIRSACEVSDIDGDGVRDNLVPAGILWMQGESDAAYSVEIANDYEKNLKRLVDLIRAAMRADDLPIAIGRISDSKKGSDSLVWKHGELVRAAQERFVLNDKAARLVTNTDTYSYSDPWHYDSKGYLDLGNRFAESIQSIPIFALGSMFADKATLEVVVGNGAGGEGPAWDKEWGILTSGNGNIHRMALSGEASVFREGAGTNGLLLDSQGRLIACEPKSRRVTRTDRNKVVTVLTDTFEGKKYNTPNDLSIDSKGRIYFSDPRYGERESMEIRDEKGQTIEGVYRIDTDSSVHRVLGREVDRANGVLVTADDRYLLVADNNNNEAGNRKLWRFELEADGTVKKGTASVLFDWGKGRGPDGIKQDGAGHLYVAAGLNRSNPPSEPDASIKAGIYVLDINGNWLDFLPVPTDEVTNCAFGDTDLKTLYITAGGVLYRIRTKHQGR